MAIHQFLAEGGVTNKQNIGGIAPKGDLAKNREESAFDRGVDTLMHTMN